MGSETSGTPSRRAILLDVFDWTTDRRLFSVLVWLSLEVREDEAFSAQLARAEQVKQVIR
jgi:hypothetical protein